MPWQDDWHLKSQTDLPNVYYSPFKQCKHFVVNTELKYWSPFFTPGNFHQGNGISLRAINDSCHICWLGFYCWMLFLEFNCYWIHPIHCPQQQLKLMAKEKCTLLDDPTMWIAAIIWSCYTYKGEILCLLWTLTWYISGCSLHTKEYFCLWYSIRVCHV